MQCSLLSLAMQNRDSGSEDTVVDVLLEQAHGVVVSSQPLPPTPLPSYPTPTPPHLARERLTPKRLEA